MFTRRKRLGRVDPEDHGFSEGPGGGLSYVPSLETTPPEEDGEIIGGGHGPRPLSPEAREALGDYDLSSIDRLAGEDDVEGLDALDPTTESDTLQPMSSEAREALGDYDLSPIDSLGDAAIPALDDLAGASDTAEPSEQQWYGGPPPAPVDPDAWSMSPGSSMATMSALTPEEEEEYAGPVVPEPAGDAGRALATPVAPPTPGRQERPVPGLREATASAASADEFGDIDAPDTGAGALGNPEGPAKGAQDPNIAMWDRRIQRLQDLQAATRSAAMRRVLGRMLTSAIAAGSRAIAMSARGQRDTARRSYERPWGEQSGEEGVIQNLIAEQGGEYEAEDQMRDQALLQMEQMRQGQGAAAETSRHHAAQESRWDSQSQTDAARRDRMAAQAERTRGQHARAEGEIDPDSEVSGRSRDEVRLAFEALPPDVQASFEPRMAEIDGMSAREVDMLRSDIQRFGQGRLSARRGAPGRSGSGAAPDATVAAAETRLSRLVDAGVTDRARADRILAGMRSPNPRTRREVEGQIDNLEARLPTRPRAAAGADASGGVEILPGVFSHMTGIEPRERVATRTTFDHYRSAITHLDRIRDLVDQNGGLRALLDPQIRAQIQRRLPALRAMVTEIQRTGIIQIGEREAIDAELPDPTSATQQALQTYMTNLEEWELQNNDLALIALEDRGVEGEDLARAHTLLFSAAGHAPGRSASVRPETAPQQGGRVRVSRIRDGQAGDITQEAWDRDQARPEGERRYRAR